MVKRLFYDGKDLNLVKGKLRKHFKLKASQAKKEKWYSEREYQGMNGIFYPELAVNILSEKQKKNLHSVY